MGATTAEVPEPRPAEGGGARGRALRRWARCAPVALLALVLTAFFAPAIFTGDAFIYRDTGRMHAPLKRWIGEELRKGRLPEWNPYEALGTPVVANGIDAVLHPFNFLLLALPPGQAMKAWVLLSFGLACAGAFALARILRCSPWASAAGALAFALSGPLVSASDNVHYLITYAGLPWLLAGGLWHARRGGPLPLLAVAGGSFLCASGGDPQS